MPGVEIPAAHQLIGGEWTPARHKGELDVIDPATHEVVQTVAKAERADIDDAVSAARRAFPRWAATNPSERGALLRVGIEVIGRDLPDLGRVALQRPPVVPGGTEAEPSQCLCV